MNGLTKNQALLTARDYALTAAAQTPPADIIPQLVIHVEAGEHAMGSDRFYPEERPSRRVQLPAFGLDARPVTNRDFAHFVAQTGWVSVAERDLGRDPGFVPSENLQPGPGSFQFVMRAEPVDLRDPSQWWQWRAHACWYQPEGEGSDLEGRMDHPVIHVAYEDAQAFARFAGKRLPDEVEWEAAARLVDAGGDYAWGREFFADTSPTAQLMANVWTGAFPWYFARVGQPGTSAIGAYPPLASGFYDLIGNVWEWTQSDFAPAPMTRGPSDVQSEPATKPKCGCGPVGSGNNANASARQNHEADADRVLALKGGSHLCAGEYCLRYRPSARNGVPARTTTSHIGFRCAKDVD